MSDIDWREGLQLRMAAAGHSARSLSLAAGLSPTAVRDILSGRSKRPRFQTLYRVAQVLGCTPEELKQPPDEALLAELAGGRAAGRALARRSRSPQADLEAGGGMAVITILEAGAFDGARAGDETANESLGLPRRLLERLGARDPLCLRVTEDAMAPSINPGDLLLLDRTQTRPREDGLYALLRLEQLIVRRLQIDPVKETVSVLADNPRYAAVRDLPPEELRIFGRVLWQGRAV